MGSGADVVRREDEENFNLCFCYLVFVVVFVGFLTADDQEHTAARSHVAENP